MNVHRDVPPDYTTDLFVNRQAEIDLAKGIVDDVIARGSGPRTVIWVGDRGTGKSWLLRHLQRALKDTGRVDVVLLDLAKYAGHDPIVAVKDILRRFAGEVLHDEDLPGRIPVDMSRALIERLQAPLAERPLAVLVDSVYESDWALLAALEDYLLGPLAIQPRVILLLAGRGRPYPFKAIELKTTTKVCFQTLSGFGDITLTREQLKRQQQREPENVEAIYHLSRGNPLVSSLLAQYADSGEGVEVALEEMIENIPLVVMGVLVTAPAEQQRRIRHNLEALCVLRSFDDARVGPMLAAYYDDPAYANWPRSRGRQVRDELVDSGFATWDKDQQAFRIGEPLSALLQEYLRSAQRQRWQTLNCAAYHLYQQWAKAYERSANIWQAEAEYHRNQRDFSLSDCEAEARQYAEKVDAGIRV